MPEDFAALLSQTQPALRRFALSLTRHRDDAEDLMQDVMLTAWRCRDQFQPGTRFKQWVFTICMNRYRDLRRRAHVRLMTTSEDVEQLVDITSYAPPAQEAAIEIDETLRAVKRLALGDRQVLMGGGSGATYDEIALLAAIPVGTVKSRLHRARARLLHALAVSAPPVWPQGHARLRSETMPEAVA